MREYANGNRPRAIGHLPASVLGIALLAAPLPGEGQTRRSLITESTVTFGRGGAMAANDNFIAEATAVADLGLRWVRPGGLGLGLSLLGGRDFPNEATLLGVRLRASREISAGLVEGSVAAISSSAGAASIGDPDGFGTSLALAYYPVSWFALVAQLDLLPTTQDRGFSEEPLQIRRDVAPGAGLRLAETPGVIPWLGAAALGAAWLLLSN